MIMRILFVQKIMLFCFLVFAFVLPAGFVHAQALKIAVVDVEAAIEASHHFTKIKSTLDKEFAPLQTDLKTLSNEIIALEERYIKDAAIMGETEARRLQQEIIQRKSSLKFESQEAQRRVNARQQELFVPVLRLAEQALQEMVDEKNYDLILPRQTVVHFKDEYSLTKELTEKLNKKK